MRWKMRDSELKKPILTRTLCSRESTLLPFIKRLINFRCSVHLLGVHYLSPLFHPFPSVPAIIGASCPPFLTPLFLPNSSLSSQFLSFFIFFFLSCSGSGTPCLAGNPQPEQADSFDMGRNGNMGFMDTGMQHGKLLIWGPSKGYGIMGLWDSRFAVWISPCGFCCSGTFSGTAAQLCVGKKVGRMCGADLVYLCRASIFLRFFLLLFSSRIGAIF